MNAAEVQAAAIAERRRHLDACHGCGANLEREPVEHRPDCTAEPSALICDDCDAIRLPSEPKTPAWRYDPSAGTYHCPTHHQKGTTP